MMKRKIKRKINRIKIMKTRDRKRMKTKQKSNMKMKKKINNKRNNIARLTKKRILMHKKESLY